MKKAIFFIALAMSLFSCNGKKEIVFETSSVVKGSISNSITATGTVQAVRMIAIGTQVSGEISKVYVDFNSQVKKGQLLAELDRKNLLAELESARANLNRAKADRDFQEKNYQRIKTLFDKGLIAQADYDDALHSYTLASNSLITAQSSYNKSETNLSYSKIYSPIDGVVLSRAVDEGQTVAASFNTPTLFSIANDLTQMQVEANIDEADIGQVKNGQKVNFTVDAFPDLNFSGEVTEIRLEPIVTNNVVTYTVIIKAKNSGNKLMPGMTANIVITTEEAKDVLLIPSRAVRFSPDSALLVEYISKLPEEDQFSPDSIKPKKTAFRGDKKKRKRRNRVPSSVIWVKDGIKVYPTRVRLGINDENNAQVLRGLKIGMEVITAMEIASEDDVEVLEQEQKEQQTTNPFMPQRRRR